MPPPTKKIIIKRTGSKLTKNKNKKPMLNKLLAADQIVFYDDDLANNIVPFRRYWPRVKAIYVPEGLRYEPILKDQISFHYPRLFLEKYPLNRYAIALNAHYAIVENQPQLCENSTGNALLIEDMQKLNAWANNNYSNYSNGITNSRAVLFDWDKTLSVFNGVILPQLNNNNNNNNNNTAVTEELWNDMPAYLAAMPFTFVDMAQYYAGTIERFHALRNMFVELRRNQVHCIIFTNNGWAHTPKKMVKGNKSHQMSLDRLHFFLQLAQVYDPEMTVNDIIYGHLDKAAEFGKHPVLKRIYSSSSKRKRV